MRELLEAASTIGSIWWAPTRYRAQWRSNSSEAVVIEDLRQSFVESSDCGVMVDRTGLLRLVSRGTVVLPSGWLRKRHSSPLYRPVYRYRNPPVTGARLCLRRFP